MSKFDDHPTVKRVREQTNTTAHSTPVSPLDADWLRNLCLEAGADDVGFVEINRPELADQRREILAAFAPTQTLISIACHLFNRLKAHLLSTIYTKLDELTL